MVKVSAYLIVSKKGSVRFNKTGTGVNANEIAVRVNLDVPDPFFVRPAPVVNVKMPNWIGEPAPIEEVLEISAATVAEALHVDVDDVRDGLQLAIDRANEEDDDED